MARTLRAHLGNVIGSIRHGDRGPTNTEYADALLADPVLATIFGKAARTDIGTDDDVWCEASALLDNWVASR